MLQCHTIAELRQTIKNYQSEHKTIAFVPTMGNLHQGHLSLLHHAKQHADKVISSIFVNPLQFAPDEDFSQYPRTLETDLELLQENHCDVVFLPPQDAIIAQDSSTQTQINVPLISAGLEGAERPGHLSGVATIVTKLFNIVEPDIACFGKKDYQQWLMIKKMVTDLNMQIQVIGCETVRESDGLALSSRNQYLNAQQRKIAPLLRQALISCADNIQLNKDNYLALLEKAKQQLIQQSFNVDYLELRQQHTLSTDIKSNELVLLCAARLGSTRLLDNIEINLNS